MVGKDIHSKTIGILALQGDVSLHRRMVERLGAPVVTVTMPAELRTLDGLVIPGGESTALLRLIEPIGMDTAIQEFARSGRPILGTCAGAIILAEQVTDPVQSSLKLIDITIQRNGYGRQVDSFEGVGKGQEEFPESSVPMVFIRAPRITALGPGVQVLASYQAEPVLVRQNNILAASFHPELSDDLSLHTYFLELTTK